MGFDVGPANEYAALHAVDITNNMLACHHGLFTLWPLENVDPKQSQIPSSPFLITLYRIVSLLGLVLNLIEVLGFNLILRPPIHMFTLCTYTLWKR